MKWLKGLGSAVVVALLAFMAVLATGAAKRRKGQVEKWRQRAEDEIFEDVEDSLGKAKKAQQKADSHDIAARAARRKAEERLDAIGEKDEDLNKILDRWRADDARKRRRRVRHNT